MLSPFFGPFKFLVFIESWYDFGFGKVWTADCKIANFSFFSSMLISVEMEKKKNPLRGIIPPCVVSPLTVILQLHDFSLWCIYLDQVMDAENRDSFLPCFFFFFF